MYKFIVLQGTPWVYASQNFGTRSCFSQCFSCTFQSIETFFCSILLFSFVRCILLEFYNSTFKSQNYLKQIPDVFPVLAAAHKTLVSKSRESLTTRTLHSELVYNYSGSKHVKLLANQLSSFTIEFFYKIH